MSALVARPWRVLAIGLIILSAVGAVLLAQPSSTAGDARSAEYFWARQYWRCAFDAVSAASGAGLLLQEYGAAYTDTGRRWLNAIGAAGALLYVACLLAALRQAGVLPCVRATHPALLSCGFAVVAFCLAALTFSLAAADASARENAALRTLAAFCALGWPADGDAAGAWGSAALGLLGGGWLAACVLAPRAAREAPGLRRVLWRAVALFLLVQLVAGGLLVLTEAPRGGAAPLEGDALAAQSAGGRWLRGQLQVLLAATTGAQREPVADRALSEAGKVVLSGAMLLGGVGGGAAGGAGFLIVAGALWPGRPAAGGLRRRGRDACRAVLLACGALVVASAFGLLLIDALVASRYDAPPALGDALLDGASAVCGGGLTSGLTQRLTSDNLTSGLRLGVNLYSFCMVWMMLMMLVGRLAPLWVLAAFAPRRAAYNRQTPNAAEIPATRTGASA